MTNSVIMKIKAISVLAFNTQFKTGCCIDSTMGKMKVRLRSSLQLQDFSAIPVLFSGTGYGFEG